MSESTGEKIIVEIKRKVGMVTLNNGDMNVFNPDFIYLLRDTLKELKDNKKVNSILIKSASDRAFSAGFDLKALISVKQDVIDIFLKDGYEIVELLYTIPKPIVALINRYSIGVGFLFPLACDFRFCTKDAKFQLPEINFGELMFPTHGGCTTLPNVVNTLSDAKYILMTGERFDADAAFKMGVVSRVFDTKEEMFEEGFQFAKLLASKAPLVMQMIKAALHKSINSTFTEGLALEKEAYDIVRKVEENREEKKNNFIKKYITG
ncbi:MAG: enoyl-CoA hydratase/isomerase family protein [Candidatus Helarchaeota archaeon]